MIVSGRTQCGVRMRASGPILRKAHRDGPMQSAVSPIRFGAFEVDVRSGEIRKSGVRIHLSDQPLQVLTLLLEHPGEVVTREELRQRLWSQDTFVDFENGLNAAVKRLREALGDSATHPHTSRRSLAEVTVSSSPRTSFEVPFSFRNSLYLSPRQHGGAEIWFRSWVPLLSCRCWLCSLGG